MVLPVIGSLFATLLGGGLNAAGSILNSKEDADNEKRVVQARNKSTRRELHRQEKYGNTARTIFTNTVRHFTPDRLNSDFGTAGDATRGIIERNLPTDIGSITSGLGPNAVADEQSRSIADAFAKSRAAAAHLGTLGGYDKFVGGMGDILTQKGRKLDRISSAASGSANVNQLEQQLAAENASRPSTGIGDILNSLGTIASYKGGYLAGPQRYNQTSSTKMTTRPAAA